MASGYRWPKLVSDEYDYFGKTRTCLKVEDFNRIFKFRGRERLRSDCAPVFFVGKISQCRFCLIGLNPAYNKKNYDKERKVFNRQGWSKTYLTFFDWATAEKISSQYYSRFAVFLACLLGKKIPKDTGGRFRLLGRNIVNLNLIPYHSEKSNFPRNFNEKQMELTKPYLENLEELVRLCNPIAIFINGAGFRSVLTEMGFQETSTRIPVNKNLQAHIGKCFQKAAIWFDKFLSGRGAGPATNNELCDAGKQIRPYMRVHMTERHQQIV